MSVSTSNPLRAIVRFVGLRSAWRRSLAMEPRDLPPPRPDGGRGCADRPTPGPTPGDAHGCCCQA